NLTRGECSAHCNQLHDMSCGVGLGNEFSDGTIVHSCPTDSKDSSRMGGTRSTHRSTRSIGRFEMSFQLLLSIPVVHANESGVLIDFQVKKIILVPARNQCSADT